MHYLDKLIEKNNIRKKLHLNVFFHCITITPPQFDCQGNLTNPDTAGKQNTPKGYLLPNVYAMHDCWPSAIEALKQAIPNLEVTFFAVSSKMLKINDKGVAGYQNPIRLIKPKKFQETQFINNYYSRFIELYNHFDIQNHWEIVFENQFVPARANSIIYAAAYEGTQQHVMHSIKTLYKIEQQMGRVIDSPKTMIGRFKDIYEFSSSKDLVERWLPQYYPLTLNCNNFNDALEFLQTHKHIVLKPPHLVSGSDVFFYDIQDKSPEETQEIIDKFKIDFRKLLYKTLKANFNHVILQKFIKGILAKGETRVYILDGKILPYGVQMYDQEPDKAFKPDKGAPSRRVLLDEAHLKIAKEFIDTVHDKLDSYYYGLDVITDPQPDGSNRYYLLEANYGTAGFLPEIAEAVKQNMKTVNEFYNQLPETLQPYVHTNYIESLVYKLVYEQLYEFKHQPHIIYKDKDLYGPPSNALYVEYNKRKNMIQDRIKTNEKERARILNTLESIYGRKSTIKRRSPARRSSTPVPAPVKLTKPQEITPPIQTKKAPIVDLKKKKSFKITVIPSKGKPNDIEQKVIDATQTSFQIMHKGRKMIDRNKMNFRNFINMNTKRKKR